MADIVGTTGDDTLAGTSGPDTIHGDSGNDFLNGGGDADVLEGGPGDDVYIVDNAGDVVVEAQNQGSDTVYAIVGYALGEGSHVETLSTIDWISSAALDLAGNSFVNALYGNAGANLLDGGGGADFLSGFGGDDVYIVDNAGDVVVEAQNQGADTVYALASYALTAGSHVETLSTIDWSSSAALNLTGNSFVNALYGNAGANILDGGGGADTLSGFGGDDVYIVDNAGDVVIEAQNQGVDTVYALASYALTAGSHVETLSTIDWSSTAALSLSGNNLANTLYGNAGANTLDGGGGADALSGFGGDDVYIIDNAGDIVIEAQNQGVDTVYAFVSYALTAGSHVETLSAIDWSSTAALNLTGNNLANSLYGNAGANTLDGGGGADSLSGFGGDDVYIVDNAGDVVSEAQFQGIDTVYALASYVLTAGSQVETLSAIDWSSTAALNLTGNNFANTIFGNAGANVLDGGGGSDTLFGFGGADIFSFTAAPGAGNTDTIADFVVGTDTIQLAGALGQGFSSLASGALRAGTLVIGTAAVDADDYLIYNSATGALLYDADGVGNNAAILVATLSTGLSLTVADFLVAGGANVAPVITSAATAQVAENSAAATIVYQVAANDPDSDRISYSLSGADAALLTIGVNGTVRLIAPADFETKATYSFNVVASDSGVSTSKAVTLTITDVAESSVTPTINETGAANDGTGTAQAIDRGGFLTGPNPNLPDDDLPSATIFGGLSSGTDQDFFSITLQAGEKLVLDVDGTTNSLDAFLALYGPNGQLIGDNDDLVTFDPGSTPPFGHNTDSQIIFRAATSGTYYFSIGSFEGMSMGNYQLNVSVGPPASAQQIQAEDIDALISGAKWNHPNLTFGFPTLASQYPSGFDEVSPPTQFEAFTGAQQAATTQLLQLVANVTTLTFTENVANPGQADLRFAESSEADVAYAYYPTNQGPTDEGGSAWFNHTNFNNPIRGNYAWMGILHEAGHALGLKHGHEFPLAISADRDSLEYSVMTYRSFPGGSVEGGYKNETFGFPQTLMMYDIAALQKTYGGANWTFNAGDSVYTWNPNTGQMSINGAGQGAPGANRVFMTVWDGGGNDTYDLSAYGSGTTINLRPGEWTTTSSTQIAGLGQGHFARGNVANALLFEGNAGSLIENAIGGAGGDVIIANQAANQLTGNGGADAFTWTASGDAGTGALADSILDFLRGTDKIDLSAIDANPATGADDPFSFIGTAAFHNVAGEVRYDVTGGSAHVFADLDGNGVADMEIVVSNVTTLAGTDFTF